MTNAPTTAEEKNFYDMYPDYSVPSLAQAPKEPETPPQRDMSWHVGSNVLVAAGVESGES